MNEKERGNFPNKELAETQRKEWHKPSDVYCKDCGNVFYNCVCKHEENE